jgi:hypothetical protein
MLYEQIPVKLREKVATELKIDLKLISTTLTQNAPKSTRFSKLKLVDEFIRQNEKIGSIDQPEEYFNGVLKMRWGEYPYNNPKMVYFGGVTENTILGLGGSLKHVLGNIGDAICVTTPFSSMPSLLSILKQGEDKGIVPKYKSSQAGTLVALTTLNLTGAEQRLEFCAKRLTETYNRERQKRVVLGSPIYVALAE